MSCELLKVCNQLTDFATPMKNFADLANTSFSSISDSMAEMCDLSSKSFNAIADAGIGMVNDMYDSFSSIADGMIASLRSGFTNLSSSISNLASNGLNLCKRLEEMAGEALNFIKSFSLGDINQINSALLNLNVSLQAFASLNIGQIPLFTSGPTIAAINRLLNVGRDGFGSLVGSVYNSIKSITDSIRTGIVSSSGSLVSLFSSLTSESAGGLSLLSGNLGLSMNAITLGIRSMLDTGRQNLQQFSSFMTNLNFGEMISVGFSAAIGDVSVSVNALNGIFLDLKATMTNSFQGALSVVGEISGSINALANIAANADFAMMIQNSLSLDNVMARMEAMFDFSAVVGNINNSFALMASDIRTAIDAQIGSLTGVLNIPNLLGEDFSIDSVLDQLRSMLDVSGMESQITDSFNEMKNGIVGAVQSNVASLTGAIDGLTTQLGSVLDPSRFADTLVQGLGSQIDTLKNTFNFTDEIASIGNMAGEFADKFNPQNLMDKIPNLKDTGSSLLNAGLSGLGSLAKGVMQTIDKSINGITINICCDSCSPDDVREGVIAAFEEIISQDDAIEGVAINAG